ncbi:MAG TPA: spore maturation protein A [Ruminococcaceae bacterium]|nr:spore maturation protein A [Oscillospiraceae bacterium]MDD5920757.1 nucleoside recognition domain-containing protein [Oscillospiraceae bacterium]HCB64763.1 spore maturation protein A [Oscillospiraceae bacterium]
MMSWLFTGMLVLSLLFGILNGRMEQVSISAVNECSNAVTLAIQLAGVMCLWSGLMRIAEVSDLTGKLSRLFRPVMKLLFWHLPADSKAAKAIIMNLTANLLGLGNAATPLGIAAMKELEKISPRKGIASNEMALLVVLNTASLQLIPTTTAALRLAAGSAAPMEILPAVWLASSMSILSGILAAKFFSRLFGKGAD